MLQILRKTTQKVLRMMGIFYASTIMIPATVIQILLSIPYLVYKSPAFIKIISSYGLIASAFLLLVMIAGPPMIPINIILSVGTMIFMNTGINSAILRPALSLSSSIKQCGEQFENFSFLEGLKLPFNSLQAQLNTIFAFISELDKVQGGELLPSVFHRDKEGETSENLITCQQKQMKAMKMSTTAEIIQAQINIHSSWFSDVSSHLLTVINHTDLVPVMIGYLIDKAAIITSIKNALIEEKSGQLYKQYQQAAKFEGLQVTNRKILTKAEQQQKLESKIESKVEETFVEISHVRS